MANEMDENQHMNQLFYNQLGIIQINGRMEVVGQTRNAQQLVPEIISTMTGMLPKNLLICFLEFLAADRQRITATILFNLRQVLEDDESFYGELIEDFLNSQP